MSSVKLQAIKGLKLSVVNHDLIDGTPILDIKPYLNYVDSFISDRQGWLDELPKDPIIAIEWTSLAQTQIKYLAENWNCHLRDVIEHRLSQSPFPYGSNRIRQIEERKYQLAYRTWRVDYQWEEERVIINHLMSGYDDDTLKGKKTSQWGDVPIHQAFTKQFGCE